MKEGAQRLEGDGGRWMGDRKGVDDAGKREKYLRPN